MPSHPDRVRENYEGMCKICLKEPTNFFASENYLAINRTGLCRSCQLKMYFDMEKLKDIKLTDDMKWY